MKLIKFMAAVAAISFAASAAAQRVTTETLYAQYEQVQKQLAENQAQLLRLEGAIKVLELNDSVTTDSKVTSAGLSKREK